MLYIIYIYVCIYIFFLMSEFFVMRVKFFGGKVLKKCSTTPFVYIYIYRKVLWLDFYKNTLRNLMFGWSYFQKYIVFKEHLTYFLTIFLLHMYIFQNCFNIFFLKWLQKRIIQNAIRGFYICSWFWEFGKK